MALFCLPLIPHDLFIINEPRHKIRNNNKDCQLNAGSRRCVHPGKSSCWSLPELASNGSGTSTFIWGVQPSPSIWCHERGMSHSPCLPKEEGLAFCQDCHARLLCVSGPVWLNASLAELPTGEEFVTSAARGMTLGQGTGSSANCRDMGRRVMAQVQRGLQVTMKRP